jgi:tetratricopeptide (TPR) repeat protein
MQAMAGNARIATWWLGIALAFAVCPVRAQDTEAQARFTAESLRFRTALHYDPLLDAPLEGLVKRYLEAERLDELIALYRGHIAQYPDDAGAKTVLVRILRRTDRTGADELLAEAVPRHPGFAPLHFMLFRTYEERGDPRAVEALAKAIDLENAGSRRNAWLEELLDLSEGETARALGKAQLAKSLSVEGLDGPSLVSLARLAQRHRFWEESLDGLKRAKAVTTDAGQSVEIDLMQAIAMGQLNQQAAAESLLSALLGRLAPDHWRRREILTLRFGVLASDEERKALLASLEAAARAKPADEGAQLDLGEALLACERRDEAAKQFLAASRRLPASRLLESRALEVLEGNGDLKGLADLLTERLELAPDRLDLRFRLVKAEYALKRDAAAEQDFRTVVAGLDPEAVSERLLELQRYLRGIERVDAAAGYLEQYVRSHPARLDVARELAEVRLAEGAADSIAELVRMVRPEESEAGNVLDFAEFLIGAGLVQPARTLVEAKLAVEPRQFELGLKLIEILGKLGDAGAAKDRITALREMTDTAPRYRQWLEASVGANRLLESLPGFLDSELNRYQFDEASWPEDKVEKFLILCEAGQREQLAGRVAEGLRRQLAQEGIDAALKLRLRRMLVAVLKDEPSAVPEVEAQLELLATEDPAHRSEHDLQRALVYQRNGRPDLARPLFAGIDFDEVGNLSLLREAADGLVVHDFLDEAAAALKAVTSLEPSDLLSWELRLSVLAALGEESELRAVLRGLRSGEHGVALREQSHRALDDQLEASFWRSVVVLLESGRTAEVLPLLAAIDQEAVSVRARLWSGWTRIRVLSRLGRETEAREALVRLQEEAAARQIKTIAFPDGMTLELAAAGRIWTDETPGDEADLSSALFLTENPVLRWAFELPEGLGIFRVERTERHVLVLDDRLGLHCLDASHGKLIWRGRFDEDGTLDRAATAPVFVGADGRASPEPREKASALTAKVPPRILVSGDRFILLRGREAFAHAAGDGSVVWSAALPPRGKEVAPRTSGRASPGIRMARANDRVVIFDAESGDLLGVEEGSGKQLWSNRLVAPAGSRPQSASLSTGLEISGDLGIAYGDEAVVFNAANGDIVWRFHEGPLGRFPVVLRPPREEESGPAPTGEGTAIADPASFSRFDLASRSPEGLLHSPAFFKGTASLAGPAVFWSESRRSIDTPSAAAIDGGSLWLMQGDSVRRLCTDLPLAARRSEARGTFVGRVGDHAWFLDRGELIHVDFHRQRSLRLTLGDLGNPKDLHATLAGNHLVVRDHASVVVFNALTGDRLGRAALPSALVEYLAAMLPAEADEETVDFVWQGRLHRSGPGRPLRCLPISDSIGHGACLATFGHRLVVSLEPAPAPGTAVPPAPVIQ